MKILHLCLANFYIDNFSYQENMLTRFHKSLGLDVEIIASLESFDKNGKPCFLASGKKYINEYGISVTRLDYKKFLLSKRLRRYNGTYKAISEAKPDIIFLHGVQFFDILHVANYLRKNPRVKAYADNHADFSNSATNWLSKNILHKILWRYCARKIEPYILKFYGVLPARVDFLRKVYRLPPEKVELLVMGADDDKIKLAKRGNARNRVRARYNISANDFLIITGGKIDQAKWQTVLLMNAIKQVDNPNVKLIVFGSVVDQLKEQIESLADGEKIQYIGWVNSDDIYDFFAAADLGVFPGRHSVLWEQAVAMGLPCVFKHWMGTTHVDLGGNCIFLFEDSVEILKDVIEELINSPEAYQRMKDVAETLGSKEFSYAEIAKRSIGFC